MSNRLRAALAAARWLGTKEGSREHRELLAVYNGIKPLPRGYRLTEKDPWCAGFVSAAAVMAGFGENYPLECSCARIMEKAQRMGIWVEDDAHVPLIGDWVLYDWQGKDGECVGAPDHVGIVIGREGDELLIVEGNYDNAVKLRKIPVGWEKIRGFVCPGLEEEGDMIRYRTLEEVPGYARETIRKLTQDGSLKGIGEDDLGLSEELIRILVILDRRGKL